MIKETSLRDKYEKLRTYRRPFEVLAENISKLTLPMAFIPDGANYATYSPCKPKSALGGRGLSSMAAKLALELFPIANTFFELFLEEREQVINDFVESPESFGISIEEAGQIPDIEEYITEIIDSALSTAQVKVKDEFERTLKRPQIYSGLLQYLIAGNVLIYVKDNGTIVIFTLKEYVIRRDSDGEPLELIIKQSFYGEEIPEGLSKYVIKSKVQSWEDESNADKRINELYTGIFLQTDGSYLVFSEIDGTRIPESVVKYKSRMELPFLPIKSGTINSRNYGIGYLDSLMPDLNQLDRLLHQLDTIVSVVSRSLLFVNPNGITEAHDIAEAPNGAVVPGKASDVTSLQLTPRELSSLYNYAMHVEQTLESAFLIGGQDFQRRDRVTATEVMQSATTSNAILGGIFSELTVSLQLPLLNLALQRLSKMNKISDLQKYGVKPKIVAGLLALGYKEMAQKQIEFIQSLPTPALESIKWNSYVKTQAKNFGIDWSSLVISKREMDEAARQMQMNETMAGMAKNMSPQIAEKMKELSPEELQQQAESMNG